MLTSPSSRRAWVEIISSMNMLHFVPVALLAEGVGRNPFRPARPEKICMSPSSRRAWIEIDEAEMKRQIQRRRPPRGGRG